MTSMDAGRLARAATLQVRPLQREGAYIVSGGAKAHRVSFPDPHGPGAASLAVWCDCEDFNRGRGLRACKHVLAVAITLATDEERVVIASMLGIG